MVLPTLYQYHSPTALTDGSQAMAKWCCLSLQQKFIELRYSQCFDAVGWAAGRASGL